MCLVGYGWIKHELATQSLDYEMKPCTVVSSLILYFLVASIHFLPKLMCIIFCFILAVSFRVIIDNYKN